MDKFLKLLDKIKKIPGAYLGKKSLDKLSEFISCYELVFKEITGQDLLFVSRFSIYIEYEYKTKWDQNQLWSDIISQNKTPEEAFDLFYEHLEKFKILLKTPDIFQTMQMENMIRQQADFEQWKSEIDFDS